VTRSVLAVQAAAAAAVSVAGFAVLASGRPFGSGFQNALSPRVGVDPPSGFFLGMLGLVAAAAFLFRWTSASTAVPPTRSGSRPHCSPFWHTAKMTLETRRDDHSDVVAIRDQVAELLPCCRDHDSSEGASQQRR
jgi:hypothetical protein